METQEVSKVLPKKIKFPKYKFKQVLRGGPAVWVLVGLLVAGAFYIGTLRTELAYLKKGQIAGETAPPPAPNPASSITAVSGAVPEVVEGDYVRGNRDAKVLLIEYSDLECPFCKRFHPTMQQVLAEYGDKVAWVYRHYPLSFHANAQKEAEAAECAGELGGNEAFWSYIDKIFERTASNGTGFALEKLTPLAAEIGQDPAKFKACLDSGKFAEKVKEQMSKGSAAGVTGTPGTFILAADGTSQLIPGALPFDQVKTAVDSALQK